MIHDRGGRHGGVAGAARPVPECAGDVVPSSDEFASWPRLGVLSADLTVGPLAVRLERIDAAVQESLARWTAPPGQPLPASGRAWRDLEVSLEFTRAGRDGYLALLPGQPARLACWREGSGLAMVTHAAAMLMDGEATRGIVVLAPGLEPDLDLALQNVIRVACAWRLAVSGRGILLHAAAVESDEGAVVLLGPSGAGKTTAARMSWPRPVLSDDVVVLTAPTVETSPWLVHPTPLWADPAFEARALRQGPLPLAGAVRLRHAPATRVERLGRAAAAAALMAHAPFLAPVSERLAPIAERLVREANFATLHFRLDTDFWPALHAWIREEGPTSEAHAPAREPPPKRST